SCRYPAQKWIRDGVMALGSIQIYMTKKYHYRLFSAALLYLFPFALCAQITITGQINDSDQQPIFAASLLVEGTTIGTTTNENGHFELEGIPAGKATLVVRAVGYLPHKQDIHTTTPLSPLTITLKNDSRNIDEVVVSGTRRDVSKLGGPDPVALSSAKFSRANASPPISESRRHVNGVRRPVDCSVC